METKQAETAEEWVDELLTIPFDKQFETVQAIFAAGASAQRESDATLLRPIACSCAERIADNPLVTLPKGEG